MSRQPTLDRPDAPAQGHAINAIRFEPSLERPAVDCPSPGLASEERLRLVIRPSRVELIGTLGRSTEEEVAAQRALRTERLCWQATHDVNLDAVRRDVFGVIDDLHRWRDGKGELLKKGSAGITEADLRTMLKPLAEKGWSVYRRLFVAPQGFARQDKPLLQAALNSLMKRVEIIEIEVHTPHHLFPWQILYPLAPNAAKLDPNQFWGMKYILQERHEGMADHAALPLVLSVTAAICPVVDPQAAPDSLFPGHNVTHLKSVDEILDGLRDFQGDFLYALCHAGHQDPAEMSSSYLEFSSARLTVDMLDGQIQFARTPVFGLLIGCNMAPLSEWDPKTIIGHLCLRTDRQFSCVAPIAPVGPGFGKAFARAFLAHFVGPTRRQAGEALREARRDLVRDLRNPLGLLFTLYGPIETHLRSP